MPVGVGVAVAGVAGAGISALASNSASKRAVGAADRATEANTALAREQRDQVTRMVNPYLAGAYGANTEVQRMLGLKPRPTGGPQQKLVSRNWQQSAPNPLAAKGPGPQVLPANTAPNPLEMAGRANNAPADPWRIAGGDGAAGGLRQRSMRDDAQPWQRGEGPMPGPAASENGYTPNPNATPGIPGGFRNIGSALERARDAKWDPSKEQPDNPDPLSFVSGGGVMSQPHGVPQPAPASAAPQYRLSDYIAQNQDVSQRAMELEASGDIGPNGQWASVEDWVSKVQIPNAQANGENRQFPGAPGAGGGGGEPDQYDSGYGPDVGSGPDFAARPDYNRPGQGTRADYARPTDPARDSYARTNYTRQNDPARDTYARPEFSDGMAAPNLDPAAYEQSAYNKFLQSEGTRRLNAGLASKGLLGSGSAVKEFVKFGQGVAGQGYQEWVQNQLAVDSIKRGQSNLDRSARNQYFEADRNYGAGAFESDRNNRNRNFESDRSYGAGAFESDRAYGAGIYDSDRNFRAGAFESDRNYGNSNFNADRANTNQNFDIDTARNLGIYDSDRNFNYGRYVDDRNYDTGRFDQRTANLFGLSQQGLGAIGQVSGAGQNYVNAVTGANNNQAQVTGNAALAGASNTNNLIGQGLQGIGMYYGMRGGGGSVPNPTSGGSYYGGGSYSGAINPYRT